MLLSPLRSIPGPLAAKLSSYYLVLIDIAGYRTIHIHKLHQQYGPVVRVGPSEISFAGLAATREIYGQATPYMKAPWYDAMSVEPLGIFSERDRKKHADRRRLLKPAFGQTAINEVEPTIDMLVLKLVNRILEARDNPVDVLSSFRRLSLDVVGELFFGQSFKALDDDQMPQFLEWMDNQFVSLGIKYAFPPVHWLLRQLPFEGLRQMMLGPERIREYGRKTFEQYINENGRESTRRDLLTKFLSANLAAEKAGESAVLGDLEMQCEIGNLIFGGTGRSHTSSLMQIQSVD